jgi:hypothetical protein
VRKMRGKVLLRDEVRSFSKAASYNLSSLKFYIENLLNLFTKNSSVNFCI